MYSNNYTLLGSWLLHRHRNYKCILYSLGDVLVRMMEEKDRDTCRTLFGHGGPVYKVGFDPFKTMLLSCSEDSTGITIYSVEIWAARPATLFIVVTGEWF